MCQRRAQGVEFALPHLDDVIGIGESGEQGGEEQGHTRHFVELELVRHQQDACHHGCGQQGTGQLGRHHADVAVLVLQPLGQAHEEEDEHRKRNLDKVVGLVEVCARGQVVLGQRTEGLPARGFACPREQRRKGFQEQVEHRDARLPRDVHRAQHEQQRSHKHPEFTGPKGILRIV